MSTKEYKILECKTGKELEIKATALLAEGWNLMGGAHVVTSADWRKKTYTQTLYKITAE